MHSPAGVSGLTCLQQLGIWQGFRGGLCRLQSSNCDIMGMSGPQLRSEHGSNGGSNVNVGNLDTNLWLRRHLYHYEFMNWFKPILEYEARYHRFKYSELKAKIRTRQK